MERAKVKRKVGCCSEKNEMHPKSKHPILIDADILAKLMFFVQFFFIFSLRILLVDGIRFKNCIVSTSRCDEKILRLPSLFFIYFAN